VAVPFYGGLNKEVHFLIEDGKMKSRSILVAAVLAIIGALGVRIWYYWPEELLGGPHLDKIEKRGRDYILHIRQGSSLSDIVDLEIFEGYCPSNHFEFEQGLAYRPSKVVNIRKCYFYTEYMGQHGRMQFHSEYNQEEGPSKWFVFLPTDLPVDSFFDEDVAIDLDLSKEKFKVYVSLKKEHMYMTIIVKNRKIERIFWHNRRY
jgi:hypothetical protein